MVKKEIITIRKIIDHGEIIVDMTKDIKTAAEYSKNRIISDATAFNLLQIGELAHDGLTNKTIEELNHIPWKDIYGLRNRIVHGYSGVDANIIFETIKKDVPDLVAELKESMLK